LNVFEPGQPDSFASEKIRNKDLLNFRIKFFIRSSGYYEVTTKNPPFSGGF